MNNPEIWNLALIREKNHKKAPEDRAKKAAYEDTDHTLTCI